MHYWGDESVDWEGINDAAEYIGLGLKKWGRVGVRQFKEKYGTVRCYLDLGWHQFHDIAYPGYAYNQWPQWAWKLDCRYGRHLVRPLNRIILPFHVWLYRRFYRKAVEKWPHLRKEILCAADYSELLRGLL